MNFLGIGPGELMLVMVLALIIFGPGKMPEMGAGIGKAIREFRKATSEITQEFSREMSLETPPQQQPTPTAPAGPTTVAEEPHPVATPIDQELHPPVPAPTEEDANPVEEDANSAAQAVNGERSKASATKEKDTAEASTAE